MGVVNATSMEAVSNFPTLNYWMMLQKQPQQLPQHRKPQPLKQPLPRSLMLQPQPHQEITLVQEEIWLTVSIYVQMIHLICIRTVLMSASPFAAKMNQKSSTKIYSNLNKLTILNILAYFVQIKWIWSFICDVEFD